MQNFIHKGETLTMTAPYAVLASGAGALVGRMFWCRIGHSRVISALSASSLPKAFSIWRRIRVPSRDRRQSVLGRQRQESHFGRDLPARITLIGNSRHDDSARWQRGAGRRKPGDATVRVYLPGALPCSPASNPSLSNDAGEEKQCTELDSSRGNTVTMTAPIRRCLRARGRWSATSSSVAADTLCERRAVGEFGRHGRSRYRAKDTSTFLDGDNVYWDNSGQKSHGASLWPTPISGRQCVYSAGRDQACWAARQRGCDGCA